MRGPEPLHALRVVAKPAAVDGVIASEHGVVLRIAPDDAIVTGTATVTVDDPFAAAVTAVTPPLYPDAIVEPEFTFVHWRLTPAEFEEVDRHIEWPLPTPGQLGQGLIAGVPAKILITTDHVLVVVSAGLADELTERLW